MSKKHPTIEQIDGNVSVTEQLDDEEFYKEYDEEIESFLKTGKLGSNGELWDCLMFVISKHSSDPQKELLLALEARRTAIEEGFGPGSYVKAPPWCDLFDFSST